MQARTRHIAGFTILELLVVLVLTSLIAALIATTIAGNRTEQQREADIQAVHTALLEARAQAMRRSAATVAVFTRATDSAPATIRTTFRVRELATPLQPIDSTGQPAATAWVVFSPDGAAAVGTTDRPLAEARLRTLPLAQPNSAQQQRERTAPPANAAPALELTARLESTPGTRTTSWTLAHPELEPSAIPAHALTGPFAQPVEPVGVFARIASLDEQAEDQRAAQRRQHGPTSDTRLVPARGITQRVLSRALEAQRIADQARDRAQTTPDNQQPDDDNPQPTQAPGSRPAIIQPPSGLDQGLIMPAAYLRAQATEGFVFGPNGERIEVPTTPASADDALTGKLWIINFDPLSGTPTRATQP